MRDESSGLIKSTTYQKKVMPSLSIHILSIALCLSSGFQQGYIASVLNQPYAQIEQFINSSWIERTGHPISDSTLHLLWSLLNVCFPIATIFGQFLAGWMCSQFGRKHTALIASFLYVNPRSPALCCCQMVLPSFRAALRGPNHLVAGQWCEYSQRYGMDRRMRATTDPRSNGRDAGVLHGTGILTDTSRRRAVLYR